MEDRALRYIAKAGDGSMRDALKPSGSCVSLFTWDRSSLTTKCWIRSEQSTQRFSAACSDRSSIKISRGQSRRETLVIEGRELGQFVTDFTWYLRNLMLVQSSDDMEDVLDISSENLALLKEEASMVDADILMRYIRIFSELGGQIKYASQKRILIEIAIIKLCKPEMEKDYTSLVDRIDSLEKKLEKGVVMAAPGSARQGVGGSAQGAQGGSLPKAELPKAIPEDVKQVLTNWGGILSQLTGVTKTYLKMATRSLGPNGELMLVFDDKNAYEYVEQNRSDCQDALKAAAADRIGKEVAILVKLNDTGHASDEVYPDLGALIQMDIEEEDF